MSIAKSCKRFDCIQVAYQLCGFGVMVIFSKKIVCYSLTVLSMKCARYMFWKIVLV